MTLVLLAALVVVVIFISWWAVQRLIVVLLKHQLVDTANDRSMHKGSVPRGGGIVIVAFLLLALVVLMFTSQRYQVFGGLTTLVLAWTLLGSWDDRHDLSARKRMLFQLCFSFASIAAFGSVSVLQLSSTNYIVLSGFGTILTFFGMIWLANLYNFMDGMDGLAAAQTIVGGLTIAFWFWRVGDLHLALACLVLAASSYGFLLHNWQPAKIFMGDVGSVTIGAFFAVMIVFANTHYQIPVLSFILLFGVFVFDASVTLLRRLIGREKVWMPHRTHYYQRAALAGIMHSKVVMAAIALMVICSMIASYTVLDHDRIVPSSIAVVLLLFSAASFVIFSETRNKSK